MKAKIDFFTRPTVLDNPAIQGYNRVKCAIGDQKNETPYLLDLIKFIDQRIVEFKNKQ